MKIVFVITKANWGGAQKYVLALAQAARAAGLRAAVAYGEPGLLAQRAGESGIESIAVPELGRDVRLGSDLGALAALYKLFRRERPDIVHLNSSKAGLVGALAARVAGVPKIIFTAHGWAFNEDRPAWQKGIFRILHYFCVLLAYRTICVSDAVLRDAAWMPGARRRLVVIRNGIDEPAFTTRQEARTLLQTKAAVDGTLWIGSVAELHRNKRLDVLIEAFARVAPDFPDAALVIIGEGQEREKLQSAIAKNRLESRVRLIGHVTDASRYLKAFDIFVLPSHTESLGLSLLEAGLASLPVVASQVGGIPEIVDDGENGILFERGSADQLAEALRDLLQNPAERQRLGTSLREKVRKDFSLERMARQTLQLYN